MSLTSTIYIVLYRDSQGKLVYMYLITQIEVTSCTLTSQNLIGIITLKSRLLVGLSKYIDFEEWTQYMCSSIWSINMLIHVYTCTYMARTCMYMYILTRTCRTCMLARICTFVHTCIIVLAKTCTHMYWLGHVHVCTYIFMYMCILARTVFMIEWLTSFRSVSQTNYIHIDA